MQDTGYYIELSTSFMQDKKEKRWQMVEEKRKGGQMVETDRYWLEGKKEEG